MLKPNKPNIMNISIQTKKDKALVISIGYKSETGSSVRFVDIITEYYDKYGGVEYAVYHYGFFKHPKYWKIFKKFKYKVN